jgi:hypothetical protein
MKRNKHAVALPFNWIFALIVGGVILALAIYGTTRIISTSEEALYTESAARLISLLDPFETGLASGKSAQINFQKDTRTFYECDEFSNRPFGRQTISFSEKTIGDRWGEEGGKVTVKNKYIFADNTLEGKNLYLFSKPYFMGFKVADLIMISSDEYCFYNAPEDIEKELTDLNVGNIIFTDNLNNCTDKISVCWQDSDCDIKVSLDRVVKKGRQVYYSGDLVYAAIFSSVDNYECNLKRLKYRFNELALVYADKVNIIQQYGCGTGLQVNLESIRNQEIGSSQEFILLENVLEDLDSANSAAKGCKLW